MIPIPWKVDYVIIIIFVIIVIVIIIIVIIIIIILNKILGTLKFSIYYWKHA